MRWWRGGGTAPAAHPRIASASQRRGRPCGGKRKTAALKIHVRRTAPPYEMTAESESGWTVKMDAGPGGGGKGQGARPTELLIMGMGGCSGIDIIGILDKQRQQVTRFEVDLDAERADAIPAVFVRIHAHYVMEGEIDPGKARRAIALSLEKYCSVSRMLEATAKITSSFSINGERYE